MEWVIIIIAFFTGYMLGRMKVSGTQMSEDVADEELWLDEKELFRICKQLKADLRAFQQAQKSKQDAKR